MTDATTPIPLERCPRLARGVRMQLEQPTGSPILLYPEGVVTLNPSGADILGLCDGRRPILQIVEELSRQYGASPADLRDDVVGYLQSLREQGLIEVLASAEEPS